MAIIGIERPPDSHSGSTINEKFERTYYRTYWVYTDTIADDEYYIRTNLPADPYDGQPLVLWTAYVKDWQARLKNISVDRSVKASWDATAGKETNLGNRWIVRCEWGLISPMEASESGNPFDVRPEVTIDGTTIDNRPFDLDADGNLVLNSAGEKFDPTVTTSEQNHVIKIIRNEPTVPLVLIVNNALKINMGMWYQFPDSTVKVEPFQVQILYSQFLDSIYFKIAYTFIFNPAKDGWKRKLLDRGYKQLDSNNKLVPIYDSQGMALQDPALLDGSGHKLNMPTPPDPDKAVWLEFKEFMQIDFGSTFNFPPDIFG